MNGKGMRRVDSQLRFGRRCSGKAAWDTSQRWAVKTLSRSITILEQNAITARREVKASLLRPRVYLCCTTVAKDLPLMTLEDHSFVVAHSGMPLPQFDTVDWLARL